MSFFLIIPRVIKLVSLMKNKNTQPFIHIYTNSLLGCWFVLGFFLAAYLKYSLPMAASETALYRIIGENRVFVIYVKINWLFSVYVQLNFLAKQYYMKLVNRCGGATNEDVNIYTYFLWSMFFLTENIFFPLFCYRSSTWWLSSSRKPMKRLKK